MTRWRSVRLKLHPPRQPCVEARPTPAAPAPRASRAAPAASLGGSVRATTYTRARCDACTSSTVSQLRDSPAERLPQKGGSTESVRVIRHRISGGLTPSLARRKRPASPLCRSRPRGVALPRAPPPIPPGFIPRPRFFSQRTLPHHAFISFLASQIDVGPHRYRFEGVSGRSRRRASR